MAMRGGMRDLLIGLCGIGGVVGLVTLLLYYGELAAVATPRWSLPLALDSAGGLRTGSPVTLNGVPIGEVRSVSISTPPQHPSHPVLVEAAIERSIRLPAAVETKVETSLLGGSARLALVAQLPIAEDAVYLPQDAPPLLFGRVRGLDEVVMEALDARLATLTESLEEFRVLARTYNELGRHLADMTSELDPGDPAAESNLRTSILRANALMLELRQTATLASSWLGDEQLLADVRSTVWRSSVLVEHAVEAIDELTAAAAAVQQDVGRVADTVDEQVRTLGRAVVPVADDASKLLERLGELARLAAEGDGSVGRLLRNPELHDSVVDAAARLEITLRQLELLLQKIREEGLAVSF
jgi:ABC-type transporter Mla subunit MlaD